MFRRKLDLNQHFEVGLPRRIMQKKDTDLSVTESCPSLVPSGMDIAALRDAAQ
jgi:hypothetical protein